MPKKRVYPWEERAHEVKEGNRGCAFEYVVVFILPCVSLEMAISCQQRYQGNSSESDRGGKLTVSFTSSCLSVNQKPLQSHVS